MKHIVFLFAFCLLVVFVGHAEDCIIETTRGDRIECIDCRWSGDILYFSYEGQETTLQKDKIRYQTMKESETSETNTQREETATDSCCHDVVDETVNGLIALGVILEITEYGEAYVNNYWYLLTYSEKEKMALALAMYNCCHYDTSIWINIKDGYSGKKIAKLNAWGFKVIE